MFLKKNFLKIFNKKLYNDFKNEKKLQEEVFLFESKTNQEIKLIRENVKKKKISFLHSGHLGDILYSLPVIKELSKNKKCNLYIEKNFKINSFYFKHPGKEFFLNKKMINMVIPLLKINLI